jgi:uncharacterized membrane protein YdjX (TVP38/TMEM64 family)
MRRILPLLLLICLAVPTFFMVRSVGWQTIASNQDRMLQWVAIHPILAGAAFTLAYVTVAALSLPSGALLTVIGGLLFGPVVGWILTITGATTGAAILVIVVRSAFGATISRHSHRIPPAIQARLQRDGFSYLLALRFVPLVPFWIVNLAAAVTGIRLTVFVLATLIGIAPASFVISSIGAGVGSILAQGHTPDLAVIFTPRILLPLLGLAALSLLPILFRRRSSGAHA